MEPQTWNQSCDSTSNFEENKLIMCLYLEHDHCIDHRMTTFNVMPKAFKWCLILKY